jgi:hypothetical protein
MKSKIPSGKHLEETWILLPEAVPAAAGFNPPPPVAIGAGESGSIFPTTPFSNPVAGVQPPVGADPSTPGALFGGVSPAPTVQCHAPATSALNLLGKTEAWGITPATNVDNINLKMGKLTGAQLRKLLTGLPDGISYELDLEKESN